MKSENLSVLQIQGPVANIELRIRGRLSRSQRHAIGLSFLRQIKPWLRYFSSYSIHPMEDRRFNFSRELGEPSIDFSTGKSKLGFEIRMRRLEAGLSQVELAARMGITRSHLSELERGRCEIRPSTRRSLAKALQNPTPTEHLPRTSG